jgi:hypothetical protein
MASKIALITTGWQALQFLCANKDKQKQFDFIFTKGAWKRDLLKGFNIVELQGYDRQGRANIREVFKLKKQFKMLEQKIEFSEELWTPDTQIPLVKYLKYNFGIKKIILIEDGLYSTQSKISKRKFKELLNFVIFEFIMTGRVKYCIPKTCEVRLNIPGISKVNELEKSIVIENKLSEISKSQDDSVEMNNCEIMFLTQPLAEAGVLTFKEELVVQSKLMDEIVKICTHESSILIKHHPSERAEFSEARRGVAIEKGLNLTTLEQETPVELLVFKNRKSVKYIFSYFSSALINIKSIEPRAQCFAFIDHAFDHHINAAHIFELKNSNVIILGRNE